MDLHEKKCEHCGSSIPLVRRVLIFRPVPKKLECPTCDQVNHTTYVYRMLALFYWTWRTYVIAASLLFSLAAYVLMGHYAAHGLRFFPGFLIREGLTILAILTLFALGTSSLVQATIDFVIRPEERSQ